MDFKDVAKDSWYYNNIEIIYSLGIVNGKDAKNFDSQGQITREEISKIVGNILNEESFKKCSKDLLNKYKDNKDTSKWAEDEISLVIDQGILKGDKDESINPKSNATRAEAAVMLDRLYNLLLAN